MRSDCRIIHKDLPALSTDAGHNGSGTEKGPLCELAIQEASYLVSTPDSTAAMARLPPTRAANLEALLERHLPQEAGALGANRYLRLTTDNFIERRAMLEDGRWVERKKGEKIEHCKANGSIGSSDGEKAGIACRMKDGSMVYVPEGKAE